MTDKLLDPFRVIFGDNEKANPLFTPFILFWLAFNWQNVFIMLFDNSRSISQRISLIDSLYSDWTNNFLFPLLWALGSVILVPIVRSWYEVWQEKNRRRKLLAQDETEIKRFKKEMVKKKAFYNIEYIRTHGIEKDVNQYYQNIDSANTKLKREIEYLQSEIAFIHDSLLNRYSKVSNMNEKLNLNNLVQNMSELNKSKNRSEFNRFVGSNMELISELFTELNSWNEEFENTTTKVKSTIEKLRISLKNTEENITNVNENLENIYSHPNIE